jgi:hypothetical protein
VRARLRHRPVRADGAPGAGGRRARGRADHRDDGGRPARPGTRGAPRGAPPPGGGGTSVAVGLDRERFWDLVVDALERIGDPPG